METRTMQSCVQVIKPEKRTPTQCRAFADGWAATAERLKNTARCIGLAPEQRAQIVAEAARATMLSRRWAKHATHATHGARVS